MTVEIKVPVLPESVTDATVAKWYKSVGDTVERDENLVDLETDKVMLEVPAPEGGVIQKLDVSEGDIVTAGQLLAVISGAAAAAEPPAQAAAPAKPEPEPQPAPATPEPVAVTPPPAENSAPAAKAAPQQTHQAHEEHDDLTPAVRRMVAENGVDVNEISGTGRGGRVTKRDVENHLNPESNGVASTVAASAPTPVQKTASAPEPVVSAVDDSRREERVPMSRLRQRVAERLLQVQHESAILTTFNEINMKPVMDLRKKYKDQFEKKFGTRLGFMSFFTKASVEALKAFPAVNASIDGKEIVYHNYYDIGIAIGSERGLVVPIVRDADRISMADIEKKIREYAGKAKDGKIALEDMMGGTFTITNAGTYGSMMSTPIINPPQSGILGMHNIVERPVVEKGEIVIRPVMYVALSYDHRIIDGSDAVQFLMRIKQIIEDPARLMLQL